jgi:hypothetical protein
MEPPDNRTIYFPRYASSGQMVSHGQPDKFFDDVQRWLNIPATNSIPDHQKNDKKIDPVVQNPAAGVSAYHAGEKS